MRRKIILFTLTTSMLLNLSACSAGTLQGKKEEKTTVRIALCNQSMLENIPEVIRQQFPDVSFEFTIANNSAQYYEYLAEHDDLPDIITVRRFSLLDAVGLKDDLVDLSKTDLAATFYQNYLQNYTYEDGTINWLPALAEVWCIVANKTLFDENGIDIPNDYESFISACEQFEELGIQGFTTDWTYDYSSLETLEGFNIEALQSLEGRRWRSNYESGIEVTLDDEVWPEAFAHMEDMLERTDNVANSEEEAEALLSQGYSGILQSFEAGEIAMIRSSGGDIVAYAEDTGDEFVLLPYFGETEEQNWLLTYPYYQAAINKNSDVDADLLMEIYTYMYSQEAQDVLGLGANMLSYSTEVEANRNEYLLSVDNYLDNNRMFIRLANSQFFTAAQSAVQGMIRGEYDAQEAYDAFNEVLEEGTKEPEMDLTAEKSYPYSFDAEHGSQSSSALLNSCREVWGTDLAVSYSTSFSNSIYAGEVSSSQLSYYVAGNYGASYYLELTGAQVKSLLKTMVHYESESSTPATSWAGMNPKEANMLPVTSGCEIQVSTLEDGNGFELTGVTVNGEEMDDDANYTIVFSVPGYYAGHIANEAGIEIPDGSLDVLPSMKDTLQEYFVEQGRQVQEPTDYIQLK